MSEWKIRATVPADAQTLRALRSTTNWGVDEVDGWLADAASGKRELWIAFDAADQCVGMVALKLVDFDPDVADAKTRAEVCSLAVAPEFRGKGLARILTEVSERRARELGFEWITLNTGPNNTAALALYTSMGYAHFKQQDRPWGAAVYLRKRLAAD